MVNTKIGLIIFFGEEYIDGDGIYWWRSSIQPARTRLGADCGSDHELLIAKFRLQLKKVGKTTGPFRYDLKQIPYNYTVEVTNRVKELDLKECLRTMDEGLWHCTGDRDQNHPPRKRKVKWLSEEVFQIAEERREAKGKGEKERYTRLNVEFQIARRDKKASSAINTKNRRKQ